MAMHGAYSSARSNAFTHTFTHQWCRSNLGFSILPKDPLKCGLEEPRINLWICRLVDNHSTSWAPMFNALPSYSNIFNANFLNILKCNLSLSAVVFFPAFCWRFATLLCTSASAISEIACAHHKQNKDLVINTLLHSRATVQKLHMVPLNINNHWGWTHFNDLMTFLLWPSWGQTLRALLFILCYENCNIQEIVAVLQMSDII